MPFSPPSETSENVAYIEFIPLMSLISTNTEKKKKNPTCLKRFLKHRSSRVKEYGYSFKPQVSSLNAIFFLADFDF